MSEPGTLDDLLANAEGDYMDLARCVRECFEELAPKLSPNQRDQVAELRRRFQFLDDDLC